MRYDVNVMPLSPIDALWRNLSSLSDSIKVQLICRLSESLLHKPEVKDDTVRQSVMALAGAWNDDEDSEAMDEAALNRHSTATTRNFNFD